MNTGYIPKRQDMRDEPDPDIIRGIERVTGETYHDGTWTRP